MYISSWQEHKCPNCKTHNMINFGDTNDCTGIDPTHCRCYHCERVFELDCYEDDELYMEDIFIGRKVPERV